MSRVDQKPWGCWLWTGATHERGYGRMRWHGKVSGAHRVAYEVFRGEHLKPSQMVLHRCDEPRCINPDHLYLGDQGDNMRDRIERNRVPRAKPKSPEEAMSWIQHHNAQRQRVDARIAVLREWLEKNGAVA